MTRPIALFDIDNTLYQGFSYFDLLKKHVGEGLIQPSVHDEARASMVEYKNGTNDYETTLAKLLGHYARGLRGEKYDDVFLSTEEFFAHSTNFFAYAQPTINYLRETHDIRLVTGEPQFVAQAVGKVLGVDQYASSEYDVEDGRFTGKVGRYLASRQEKLAAIQDAVGGRGDVSFAFGDSEGDIEMLRAVKYAICLNPTDGLRAVAEEEGWHLPEIGDVERLVRTLV